MPKPQLVIALPLQRALSKEEEERLKIKVMSVAMLMREYEVLYFVGIEESVSHCRNAIVNQFLALPDAQWLWFTALGMEWEASDLSKLIQAGKPVLGALYTTAEEWPRWECKFYDGLKTDNDGMLQVPEIGANALLIHRTAFEHILANPAYPLAYRDENTWEPHHAFFQQARVNFKGLARLLREEQFFSWLCRESLIGVFAHTRVQLKRKGPDGELYPKLGQEPALVATPPEDAGQWPVVKQEGRFVIIIQAWEGDYKQGEKLANEILGMDFPDPNVDLILRSSEKGLKYPTGPNKLAWDLMNEAANGATWAQYAKCILLIEPDCVPVAPDWIDQLSEEWDRAAGQGKLIMGAWTGDDMQHLNGNLIFSPKLASVIDLGPTPPRRPWDVAFAPAFRPHWCKTGLIKNLYRSTNVTDEQIETPECGTKPPVLIHGCRDDSVWNYAKRKLT